MNLLRFNKEIYPTIWYYDFLDEKEIEKILEYSKKINSMEATIGGQIKKKEKYKIDSHLKDINSGVIPRHRQSILKWILLNNETNWIFKKIIKKIHEVNQENFDYILKYVEDLQLTEYNDSQNSFYAKHVDCGKKDDLEHYVDIRKLSFTIQLSDSKDYEGGDLIIYDKNIQKFMPRERGSITFFSSDLEHEVTPIKKGTRYSLVSWVQGPNLR